MLIYQLSVSTEAFSGNVSPAAFNSKEFYVSTHSKGAIFLFGVVSKSKVRPLVMIHIKLACLYFLQVEWKIMMKVRNHIFS